MALAALASLSRGGARALAAGAAACSPSASSRLAAAAGAPWRPRSVAGCSASILVALVPPEAHERLRTLSGASFRLDTWRDSLRLAASSPVLGHGLGAFHDAYPRFKRGHGIVRVEHAENDYLETLAETGAPGLGPRGGRSRARLRGAAGRGTPDPTAWCAGSGGRARGARGARGALGGGLQPAHPVERRSRRARRRGRRPRPDAPAAAVAPARGALAAAALALAAASTRLPDRPGHRARGERPGRSCRGQPAQRHLRLERAEEALARRSPAPRAGGVVAAPGLRARALGRDDTAGASPPTRLARPGAARSARSRRGARALTPTAGLG